MAVICDDGEPQVVAVHEVPFGPEVVVDFVDVEQRRHGPGRATPGQGAKVR